MKLRNALICSALLSAILLAAGCDVLKGSLAVSGPKRYQSETSSLLLEIKAELDNTGTITDATHQKLDRIMAKWQPEMGKFTSFRKLTDMRDEIDKIKSEPNNAFDHKQLASAALEESLASASIEVSNSGNR